MRILGLDMGSKRIGVAISDPDGVLASPVTVITRNEDEVTIESILNFVRQYQVKRIIVGLPRSLSGNIGNEASKVQAFVEKLSQRTEVGVETWDERLSTVAADRMMREAGTKKSKRKIQRDALAAAFILQGYLDSLRAPK